MKTYIALLKGINVGGHKKIPMDEFRDVLTKSGFQKVQTYIQSGNVVFQSFEEKRTELEETIQKKILSHFGFEVSVLVRKASDLKSILDSCPFTDDKKVKSYFTLLHKPPDKNVVEDTKTISYPNEEFEITNACVYFYSEIGYGNAKCNNNFFERKLKVSATTRNYKTMVKLLSLSQELER